MLTTLSNEMPHRKEWVNVWEISPIRVGLVELGPPYFSGEPAVPTGQDARTVALGGGLQFDADLGGADAEATFEILKRVLWLAACPKKRAVDQAQGQRLLFDQFDDAGDELKLRGPPRFETLF